MIRSASSDTPPSAEYVAPTLGAQSDLADVTLFSGVINPDAGTVDFGDG